MFNKSIILPSLLCSFATSNAFAFCYEPSVYVSAPSFYETQPSPPGSYAKPDVPYCMAGFSYSREHTCSEWEIDQYFDDVSEYIDGLNDYLREAQAFAEAARTYAEEAISLANQIQTFADDAYSFASCEAEEVKSQHE